MFRRVLVPVFTVACRGKKNKPRLKKGAPSSAEKTKFIPKAFLQKQMAAAAAAERLIATERPGGSLDGEDLEEWLKRKPVDDVWIREHYPPQAISVTEAVLVMIFSNIQCTILFNLFIIFQRHRELAQPAMLNNPNGLLYLNLRLDMTTTKKTKFVGQFSNQVRLPHDFDDGKSRRILAFCKTTQDQDIALKMGAIRVGLDDLIEAVSCCL